ncbi:MAG: PTS sugar transporter subunit IIA, partial [Candidatus Cloacimonetes bacterium]|nr:PTS sugar transporter subunit IIA [Candidatus Cloacimonadota bacterium]
DAEDVFIDTQTSDPRGMLAYLSAIAARKTGVAEETILQELTAREEQLSTAMGRSVALPHARLEGIESSQLFIVHNQHGIEWDSPDGLPVHLFILILTPKAKQNAQIQILRSLSLALQDRKLTSQLVDSTDPKFLWNSIRSELTSCSRCRLT